MHWSIWSFKTSFFLGNWTFEAWFFQILALLGQNLAQMPHPRAEFDCQFSCKHLHLKIYHISSSGKTWQFLFKFPILPRQGSNSLPHLAWMADEHVHRFQGGEGGGGNVEACYWYAHNILSKLSAFRIEVCLNFCLFICCCCFFNLPNHFKQHMAVCGLSLHLGSSESHITQEQQFIFQIGTLNSHGVNEPFSFN